MANGRVTLMDVARAAGVSRSTAARSLGGYGNVDPGLHASVLAAAKDLGYRANTLARSVSSGRSHTIGVVVSDIENPHFARAVRGVSDVARHHGFDVLLVNTDEKLDLERAAVSTLLDKRVDGLIVAPSTGTAFDHLQDAVDMNRAVVLLDRNLPELHCDWVGADDYTAAAQIVNSLTDAGHREVCLVAATNRSAQDIERHVVEPISSIAERVRALRDTAHARDISYRILTGAMSQKRTRQVIREAMTAPNPPTALIGSYSEIVLTVVDELRSSGWRIPDDVSVASLDDARWMTITTPSITAARRPSYDMGCRAADVLLQRLADTGPVEREHLLPIEVVNRESICRPRTATLAG
jgi:LacI family transcriptional regulator